MSTNSDLAQIFHTMATVLEIKGENAFKVNANTNVARALEDLVEDIATIHDPTTISGVGKSSAAKIKEYIETGAMPDYDALVSSIPSGLLDLMRVQGLGPKTVRRLWQEVDVTSLQTLRDAIDDGRLESMPRMGKKTIENISESLAFLSTNAGRTRLGVAMPTAEHIIEQLTSSVKCTNITFAGSLRRGKDTIGDIDILATTPTPEELATTFCTLPEVEKILAQGDTKCSVRLEQGIQVDLRVVEEENFGAALLYFTGSKEHNIALRERAIKQEKKDLAAQLDSEQGNMSEYTDKQARMSEIKAELEIVVWKTMSNGAVIWRSRGHAYFRQTL